MKEGDPTRPSKPPAKPPPKPNRSEKRRIELYEKAMRGWSSYAWKDGEYIDNIQSYFDDVINRGRTT